MGHISRYYSIIYIVVDSVQNASYSFTYYTALVAVMILTKLIIFQICNWTKLICCMKSLTIVMFKIPKTKINNDSLTIYS